MGRAQPGRLYALIQDGRVHQIFDSQTLSCWNDALPVIDITDLAAQPGIGDYWRHGKFWVDPGPAPSEYHVLDTATYTWQPLDAPTVEQMKTAEATRDFEAMKLFRAKCISDLAFRLGKPPGQLTVEEIRAERDRLVAIYKAL